MKSSETYSIKLSDWDSIIVFVASSYITQQSGPWIKYALLWHEWHFPVVYYIWYSVEDPGMGLFSYTYHSLHLSHVWNAFHESEWFDYCWCFDKITKMSLLIFIGNNLSTNFDFLATPQKMRERGGSEQGSKWFPVLPIPKSANIQNML